MNDNQSLKGCQCKSKKNAIPTKSVTLNNSCRPKRPCHGNDLFDGCKMQPQRTNQTQYLYVDKNFLPNVNCTPENDKFYDCCNSERDTYDSKSMVASIKEPRNLKILLKDVAMTTHILYKTFRKAYHTTKKANKGSHLPPDDEDEDGQQGEKRPTNKRVSDPSKNMPSESADQSNALEKDFFLGKPNNDDVNETNEVEDSDKPDRLQAGRSEHNRESGQLELNKSNEHGSKEQGCGCDQASSCEKKKYNNCKTIQMEPVSVTIPVTLFVETRKGKRKFHTNMVMEASGDMDLKASDLMDDDNGDIDLKASDLMDDESLEPKRTTTISAISAPSGSNEAQQTNEEQVASKSGSDSDTQRFQDANVQTDQYICNESVQVQTVPSIYSSLQKFPATIEAKKLMFSSDDDSYEEKENDEDEEPKHCGCQTMPGDFDNKFKRKTFAIARTPITDDDVDKTTLDNGLTLRADQKTSYYPRQYHKILPSNYIKSTPTKLSVKTSIMSVGSDLFFSCGSSEENIKKSRRQKHGKLKFSGKHAEESVLVVTKDEEELSGVDDMPQAVNIISARMNESLTGLENGGLQITESHSDIAVKALSPVSSKPIIEPSQRDSVELICGENLECPTVRKIETKADNYMPFPDHKRIELSNPRSDIKKTAEGRIDAILHEHKISLSRSPKAPEYFRVSKQRTTYKLLNSQEQSAYYRKLPDDYEVQRPLATEVAQQSLATATTTAATQNMIYLPNTTSASPTVITSDTSAAASIKRLTVNPGTQTTMDKVNTLRRFNSEPFNFTISPFKRKLIKSNHLTNISTNPGKVQYFQFIPFEPKAAPILFGELDGLDELPLSVREKSLKNPVTFNEKNLLVKQISFPDNFNFKAHLVDYNPNSLDTAPLKLSDLQITEEGGENDVQKQKREQEHKHNEDDDDDDDDDYDDDEYPKGEKGRKSGKYGTANAIIYNEIVLDKEYYHHDSEISTNNQKEKKPGKKEEKTEKAKKKEVMKDSQLDEQEEELSAVIHNVNSVSTQTDIPSLRAGHKKRVYLRMHILNKLYELSQTSQNNDILHIYTLKERDQMLHDLHYITSNNPSLIQSTKSGRDIMTIEKIKYLLSELSPDANTLAEYKLSEQKKIIDDLRHILNPKTHIKPLHIYSKTTQDKILYWLDDILRPPLSRNKPLTLEERRSLIMQIRQHLISDGKKLNCGQAGVKEQIVGQNLIRSKRIEKPEHVKAHQSSLKIPDMWALYTNLTEDRTASTSSISLFKYIKEDGTISDEIEHLRNVKYIQTEPITRPNDDEVNDYLIDWNMDYTNTFYEPPQKRLHNEFLIIGGMKDPMKKSLRKRSYDALKKSFIGNESQTNKREIQSIGEEKNPEKPSFDYAKEDHGRKHAQKFINFENERRSSQTTYSSSLRPQSDVLGNYDPPGDFESLRKRWKPSEDYRPFNRKYTLPVNVAHNTDYHHQHSPKQPIVLQQQKGKQERWDVDEEEDDEDDNDDDNDYPDNAYGKSQSGKMKQSSDSSSSFSSSDYDEKILNKQNMDGIRPTKSYAQVQFEDNTNDDNQFVSRSSIHLKILRKSKKERNEPQKSYDKSKINKTTSSEFISRTKIDLKPTKLDSSESKELKPIPSKKTLAHAIGSSINISESKEGTNSKKKTLHIGNLKILKRYTKESKADGDDEQSMLNMKHEQDEIPKENSKNTIEKEAEVKKEKKKKDDI